MGYSELFPIPVVTSVYFETYDRYFGDSLEFRQAHQGFLSDCEHSIALHAMQVIRPHLAVRRKSHGFSRVATGTWCMFLSYGGDDPSKLVFDQQCQDYCLVLSDTSGISSRLGRAIQTPLEVKWETQGSYLVPTVILGFLSIFNKCLSS